MKKKNKQKSGFNKRIFPLMLLMVVPLIMYYQVIKYDKIITYPYYVLTEQYVDIFSFYKSIAIYAVAAFSILFYVLYTKKNDRELRKDRLKYYIPVAVYAFFIVLSSIFAIYPKVAWFGIYERFEGALTLLSYLIIMIYSIEIIREKSEVEILLYGFTIMIFAVSTIGIFQFFGMDPFTTGWFRKLIGVPETSEIINIFNSMAFSTLYNPNNAGQFAALTIPVAAVSAIALKKIGWKIFAAIALLADILLAYASGSANSFAGIIMAAIFFAVFFIANLIPKSKTGWVVGISVVLIIIIGGFAFGKPIYNKIVESPRIQKEINSFLPKKGGIYFNDIDYTPQNIKIDSNMGIYNLYYGEAGINFCDEEMNPIEYVQNNARINFVEEPYKSTFRITIDTTATLSIYAKRAGGWTRMQVVFDEEKFLGIRGTGGSIIRDIPENQMPEKFRGLETAFSNRGYLWFSSLGRFDEVIFKGAGPDNFMYWFRQNDICGTLNYLYDTDTLADKPHNWYIQVGTQTGVLSLAALLTLIGIFFVKSFIVFGIGRKKGFYEMLGSGMVCGVAGYMASAFFVDSTVSVTPLLFFILGIGIVCVEKASAIKRKNRIINKA